MKRLIRNVVIFQPGSAYHKQKRDILIEDGKIIGLEANIEGAEGAEVRDYGGAYLSLGWIDGLLPLTIPGDERRETLHSLAQAAKAGGFTDLVASPTPLSPLDTPEALISLAAMTKDLPVHFHFVAGVTPNLNGKDLTEIGLLVQAGAIAFSNGFSPIMDAPLLIRILQYLKPFDVPFVVFPHLPWFSEGQVNDSEVALTLGYKGIPKISETLVVVYTLEVLKYVEAKVHFCPLVSTEAWDLVLEAQNKGFRVSASTSSNYLAFQDTDCLRYATMAKVFPPYREEAERRRLVEYGKHFEGLASMHYPVIQEDKEVEFGRAEPGIVHLQTSVPCLAQYVDLETLIEILTCRPFRLFPTLQRSLEVGGIAKFTIFKQERWIFEEKENLSLSRNSPYFGHSFDLKVVDTIV